MILTGTRDNRLKIGLELGADYVVNARNESNVVDAIKKLNGGKGVDYVVECSGAPNAVNEAIRMVNRGGKVCLAAFPHEETPVDVAHIVRNNIYLYGIRGEGKSATHRAEAFMSQKRFDATKVHTHTFPLEDLPTAIKYARERIDDAIKVVVKTRGTVGAARGGGVVGRSPMPAFGWIIALAIVLLSGVPVSAQQLPLSPNGVKTLAPEGAIKPTGEWNLGTRAGDFVFVAGMRGIDPKTNQLVQGDEARIMQGFMNMKLIAESEGASLRDAVRIVVYVTDMFRFRPIVNKVQAQLWGAGPYPPRTIVEVHRLNQDDIFEVEGTFYAPVKR